MTHALQALIAEVTHRCPLHCVYCSNPTAMQAVSNELPTDDWKRAFQQAGELGCWHLHLTGGEPLLRPDLEQLVRAGRDSGLYVNLITSGLGLSRDRLGALADSGLDHLQLSFQDSEESCANEYAGIKAHAQKLRVAEWVRHHRIAFTVNLVVHRQNIDRLEQMLAFTAGLNPDKIEIANVQYYGWAMRNRSALLPTRQQVHSSLPIIEAARASFSPKIRIDYVLPDYYAKYPKPCMGGWGRSLMLIDPAGRAMPCHAAGVIPGLEFPNLREHALAEVWENSSVFQRFRGDIWMQDPCRSCDRKHVDFGGCRCQAMMIAGDAAATDPVCSLSPARPKVDEITERQYAAPEWVYRIDAPR